MGSCWWQQWIVISIEPGHDGSDAIINCQAKFKKDEGSHCTPPVTTYVRMACQIDRQMEETEEKLNDMMITSH
jgi:hypothetical protein